MIRWQWMGGVVLLVLVVAAGVVAYRLQTLQATMGVETRNAFTNVREFPSPLVGEEAPQVDLTSLTGGSLNLAEHRGSLVLLGFWSHF